MNTFQFSSAVIRTAKAAFAKAGKAEATAKAERNKAGQAMVDALTLACDQVDKAKYWKSSGALEACRNLFMDCGLSESAVRNYPKSVRLAFIHNVGFRADLFTPAGQKAAGLEVKEKANPGAQTGRVTVTDKAALLKTLRKAIEQARALKIDATAAALVDAALEVDPEFKESAE